jgi:WD40 repeat protein
LRKALDLLPPQARRTRYRYSFGDNDTTISTPDGRWLADYAKAFRIDVVDSERGTHVRCAYGGGPVKLVSVALRDDGSVVAAAVNRKNPPEGAARTDIFLWRVANGRLLNTFHTDLVVTDIAVSPDGQHIAYSGDAGEMNGVRVISTSNGALAASTDAPEGRKWNDVAFTRSGDVLALSGEPLTMWSWRERDRRVIFDRSWGSLILSPGDESIVATDTDDGLEVWRWPDIPKGDAKPMHAVLRSDRAEFSADGTKLAALAVGDSDGQVQIVDVGQSTPIRTVPLSFAPPTTAVAVSNDGETIAVTSVDVVDAFNVSTDAHVGRVAHDGITVALKMRDDGTIRSISTADAVTWRPAPERAISTGVVSAVSPNGKLIVTFGMGYSDGIRVHDDSGRVVSSSPKTVYFTPAAVTNGGTLYGVLDGAIVRWDSVLQLDDKLRKPIAKAPRAVSAMAVSRSGHLAWSAGKNIYVMNKRGTIRALASAKAEIRMLRFARHDDATLLAGTRDGSVLLWRFGEDRRSPAATFQCKAGVTDVAVSHDGAYVAATCNRVQIWQVADPKRAWSLPVDQPASVDFEPFGDSILTASHKGVTSVWSGSRDEPVEVTRLLSGVVTFARFSEDGSHVIALGSDDKLRNWIWHNELLMRTTCRRLAPHRDRDTASTYDKVCAGM